MWTLSGEQTDDWLQGRVGILLNSFHSILIEGKITRNDEGDIGIDDISITNGYCQISPILATPNTGLTTPRPLTTIGMLVENLNFIFLALDIDILEQLYHIQHQLMTVILRV